MLKENTINILWTGGWDSTFRLLQLCEEDITIQPIYIIDDGRVGRLEEMDAMEKILAMIRKSPDFKATVKDILFFEKQKILKEYANPKITTAYKELYEKFSLGSQYEWFALLCNALGMRMECGLEASGRGKANWTIEKEGVLIECKDDFLENRLCVDKRKSSKNLNLVFGNLIFSITNISKKEAEKISRKKGGWMQIMELTWFCHYPIKGKPCGICNPCKDAMNEDMEWRMPEISQWRYKYLNNFLGRVIRKLSRILEGRSK